MISARSSFHSDSHRFVSFNNTSVFFWAITRVESSVPTSVERSRLRRVKGKLQKQKKVPSFRRPEQEAREEQQDTRQRRRNEPARHYPQRTPDSKRLTQAKHERNQAVLPMRLGLDSKESERSLTKSLARSRAVLASTSEGTRASKESQEPVPCGKRCQRCSTFREKRVSKRRTLSASVKTVISKFRVSKIRYSSDTTSCTTWAVCRGGTL